MSLFKPKEGELYRKEKVILLCSKYIHFSEFQGNVTEKEQKINLIKNKSSELLEFNPRGKGWGSSALNPNCWNEISDVKNLQSRNPVVIKNSKSNVTTEKSFKQETQYNRRPWGRQI